MHNNRIYDIIPTVDARKGLAQVTIGAHTIGLKLMKVWTRREIVPYDTKHGKVEKEVDVTEVDTRIHIFRGNGGYKLSLIDNKGHSRHLTLGELAWVVQKINALIEYGV